MNVDHLPFIEMTSNFIHNHGCISFLNVFEYISIPDPLFFRSRNDILSKSNESLIDYNLQNTIASFINVTKVFIHINGILKYLNVLDYLNESNSHDAQ